MAEKLYDAYHQEIELTDEQQACLDYSGGRSLIVKALPGGGKSVVIMQIARKLKDKYGDDCKNKVVIFTYQNPLVSNIKELLQANDTEEETIKVTTVVIYLKTIYDNLVKEGKAPKRRYPLGKTADDQRKANIKNAIAAHKNKYGEHRFHKLSLEFWLEEFDWMKDMNIWTNELDDYLTLKRTGRGGKVRMSSADRICAYQLFSCYCEQLEKTSQGDWADQALFLVRHPELIPEDKRYEHVLIDESQDLSLTQMKALMALSKKDLFIAMDINQRIFGRRWTTKQLGIPTTTKKLTKSMRTTKQIDALAESVRAQNDLLLSEDEAEERSLRVIPAREGSLPQLVHLEDPPAEKKYVINLIKKYLQENDKVTIGIIVAKKKQMPIVAEWLSSENIDHEQIQTGSTFSVAKPGVKLVNIYGAKGLEFDIVIIPMFAEGNFPYGFSPDPSDEEAYAQYLIKMRNLVYVSMTRARFHLVITFWGNKGSRFIADMDPDLYEMIGPRPNIRRQVFRLSSAATQPQETAPTEAPIQQSTPVQMTLPGTPAEPVQMEFSVDMTTPATTRLPGTSVPKKRTSRSKSTEQATPGNTSELVAFLESKGIEYVDKRPKGGALWIIGDKSLDPIIQETRKRFDAMWIYKAEGAVVTKLKPGWKTTSNK